MSSIYRRNRLLSPREVEVLRLTCSGLTIRETAKELGISALTVKVHRAVIVQKFGSRSMFEVCCIAGQIGLIIIDISDNAGAALIKGQVQIDDSEAK